MLKKMRWRFIGAAMAAFTAVVLTLLCFELPQRDEPTGRSADTAHGDRGSADAVFFPPGCAAFR